MTQVEQEKTVPGELEILESPGAGYNRVVANAKWTVAFLDYAEIVDEGHFHRLERHLLTDEVFVLLSGDAVLVVGEDCRRVRMEPEKVYNVKAGIWHHILMKPESRVLIAENADTSPGNTEYKELRPSGRRTIGTKASGCLLAVLAAAFALGANEVRVSDDAYRFYRFKVEATQGEALQISELRLFSGEKDVSAAARRTSSPR